MSALLRRLVRLWGQSRIRLPRRPPGPEEIEPGDRLQIGSVVWRVQERRLLETGGWMFRLEAVGAHPAEREARLVWEALPPGCLIHFPAPPRDVF